MEEKTRSWPIRTVQLEDERYDQASKYTDECKKMYHKAVVVYTRNMQAYVFYYDDEERYLCMLSLEGRGMVSTKVVHYECDVPLETIDVVSKNIRFVPKTKQTKTGQLFTGELYDFLQQDDLGKERYDIINMDSCNTWSTLKNCVETVFKRRLLKPCAVLIITCSFRGNNTKKEKGLYKAMFNCIDDVTSYGHQYGYKVAAKHDQFNYGTMYCLFFKVIDYQKTMTNPTQPWTASHWLNESMKIETPLKPDL